MAKKEEAPKPKLSKEGFPLFLPRDKVEDRVIIAKLLIPTYEKRLAEYLKKYDGEMDEIDFLKNELKISTTILDPKNHYTVGVKWEIYQKNYNLYVDFLESKLKSFIQTEPKSQNKKKDFAKNDHRLYAFEVLCSDFIKHLTKLSSNGMDTKEIGEIISYITNVNPVDAYKKTLTADKHKRIIDKEFKDKIDEYKVKINKLKG
jgi:hypothetical protein